MMLASAIELGLLWVAAVSGVLAVILTWLFGYPPWRRSRLRPDLRLAVAGHSGTSISGDRREAGPVMRIRNEGPAHAQMWRLEVRSEPPITWPIRLSERRAGARDQSMTILEDGTVVLEWRVTDATDLIPSLDHIERAFTVGFQADQVVEVSFQLFADRMQPRGGRIRISCPGQSASFEVLQD